MRMTKIKLLYNTLPDKVKSILILCNGWLVGKSVEETILGIKPKDYDIVAPLAEYAKAIIALKEISKSSSINTFGGLKFIVVDNDIEYIIDIWPSNLNIFLDYSIYINYMYNINLGLLIKNVNYE